MRLERLFEEQVRLRPEAIAIVDGSERISYAQLDAQANAIAAALRARGVQADEAVGLCMQRSAALIATMVGVMKAGAGYVALDPIYPGDRLQRMQDDSQVRFVIVDADSADAQASASATVLDVGALSTEAATGGTEAGSGRIGDHGLAYVLYTSGSTGMPKGTPVSHANVTTLLAAANAWFEFGPDDVWSQFHSYAFDFSVWEIWGALAFGGTLVMVSNAVARSPQDFLQLLRTEAVTVLNQTPSAFAELHRCIVSDAASPLPALSVVVFGGEAVDLHDLDRWFARFGDEQPLLVNMYGITETTVHVTYRPLTRADTAAGGARGTPIGVPLAHLRTYVLDEMLHPVPAGTVGEIHVAGGGVARGYLRRPALTAERFVPDPFSATPGGRLYRSGDLGYIDARGELRNLGRGDNQVKVRGYRIEIGEIEVALARHPLLAEAVVVPCQEDSGTQLMAFVRPAGNALPELEALREHLAALLPAYMVPARYAAVAALPLDVNGKRDRRALLAVETTPLPRRFGAVAAQNEMERSLLAVWADVLEVEEVGIDDNYYALGGDSIRSIQIKSKAQDVGIVFSLADLLRTQTVRLLAQLARREAADGSAPRRAPFALVDPALADSLRDRYEDAYPVSGTQMGMLYHSSLGADDAVYHNIEVHTLRLPFDGQHLASVWEALGQRHEILRTGFDLSRPQQPIQVVRRQGRVPLDVCDSRQLDASQVAGALQAWVEQEHARGFGDWMDEPLFRVCVQRLDDGVFNLIYSCHHAVLDGWSAARLTREFIDLYRQTLGGNAVQAAAQACSYADFIALEQQARADESADRLFWATALIEVRPVLFERTRPFEPRGDTEVVARVDVPVDAAASARLKVLARELEVPLKSVLLAVHLKAIAVLTGKHEVVSGLVTNGRPEQDGGDAVLGLFLNSVPLRLSTAGRDWTHLIRAAFDQEQALWPHRRLPLSDIMRLHEGGTLFDTLFNFTHFHVYGDEYGSESAAIVDRGGGFEHSSYPLILQAMQLPGTETLRLVLEADRAVFSPVQIERIAAIYADVLDHLLADPSACNDGVDFLPDGDRQQLLVWAGTPGEGDNSLSGGFAQTARAVPDAIAVQDADGTLSYAQLEAASAAIAAALHGSGVRPGMRVGVSLARSRWLVATLLGIVRTGGTYVPLDASYPDERLRAMQADAQVAWLVSDQAPEWALAPVVPWSRLETAIAGGERYEWAGRSGRSAAYVMFTSGSTGRPKGVLVSDGGIVDLVSGQDYVTLGQDDVLLQLAPVSFDASTFEIWGALLNGGRLVMAPEGRVSLSELGRLIEANGVTVLWLTAALFQLMVDEHPQGLKGLRYLLAGGDALSPAHVQRYLALPFSGTLVNGYGPTEATTFSCCLALNGWNGQGSVPIGRGVAGRTAYVLDAYGQLVPPGTVGELFVGGSGVGMGYVGHAAPTAQRFVPDPFGGKAGARLYATGDRVRYRTDGTLEYLGREDAQVKVRGFRIELGEVERALAGHPQLGAVSVQVHSAGDGKRLVAYLVARPGHAVPAAGELQRYLGDWLPEYMVPALYVGLDRLPLTANGKIDKAALPVPGAAASDAQHEEPQGEVEQALARIWAQVLEVEQVGRHENFFTLGGDSILSIQIKAQAQQQGFQFALEALFERQTVARLAEVTTPRAPAIHTPARLTAPFALVDDDVRARLPDGVEDAYPLSHMQAGMLFHNAYAAQSPTYHDVIRYTVGETFDRERFVAALRAVVARHPALRTRFSVAEYELPLQCVYRDLEPELEIEDASDLAPDAQAAVIDAWVDQEHVRGFRGDDPQWIRYYVCVLGERGFALGLSFHHALLDGWSEASLVTELLSLYHGGPSSTTLEPLKSLYRDYIDAELRALADEDARAFWQGELARSAPAVIAPYLHLEQAGEPNGLFAGKTILHAEIAIPAHTATRLFALAARLQVPLRTVLLAVHATAMAIATGQNTVTSGLIAHGRLDHADGDAVLGVFLNALPFTQHVAGERWADAIRMTFAHEQAVERHRRFPVASLTQSASARLPFDVLFNFTKFHVYERLATGQPRLDLDQRGGIAETSLPLCVNFQVDPQGQSVGGALSFLADRYTARVAQSVARIYARVLDTLDADGEAARPSSWGELPGPAVRPVPLSTALATAADKIGAVPALRLGNARLRHRDLGERIATVAAALRQRGVGPGSRVELDIADPAQHLLALLGTLGTGAETVPQPAGAAGAVVRIALAAGPTSAIPVVALQTLLDLADAGNAGNMAMETELQIVDAHGHAVPPGVIGEVLLYDARIVGGDHNRGYRSGVLARLLPDGSLEWLGAGVQCTRHRNFAIVPAEIEHHLAVHAQVGDVVVRKVTGPDHEHLVAFVVPATAGIAPDWQELRRHAAQTLPPQQVPDHYQALDCLPLDATGQLDEAALLVVGGGRSAREHEAPDGDLETVLASLWSEVLGVDMGRHTDFFQVSGDSIQAMQITARVERALAVSAPVGLMYANPTIAEFAAALRDDPDNGRRAMRAAELLVRLSSERQAAPPAGAAVRDGADRDLLEAKG
ncbi:amino acid adenylation domain-containing protein [Stenotrophomonas sp. GZD-301]|uniref:amino acid adenylation domain-containing protein n=1 Tax=Stenotrophomonas sp. GZD-301 TaxID=3404814 RepID=UPI003BB6173D